ncbi:hypothetical protein B0J13DRAFT_330067 [Dactylonectria estremocensis]|uniref:Uncharacterized protein n=1 Tax=Dactylonectria estremocensis TaxID=1079267 RepID=A0A9P9J783_9HYPO|nr:hypothetical protein B0J13DRAFT_330067 [Dactylonectria estremocensis]
MPARNPSLQPSEGDILAKPSSRTSHAQRNVSAPVDIQQIGSLGSWVKTILPSYRPERGGTAREGGFWEQLDTRNRADTGGHVATSNRRQRSGTMDSNRLAEWNIPKNLDDAGPPQHTPMSHSRAVSLDVTSSLDAEGRRKRSWAPRDDANWQKIPSSLKRMADKNQQTDVDDRFVKGALGDQASSSRQHHPHPALVLDTRREARQQRRSLKESGDYLGVQGFNPQTGVPDVITPTDSEQSAVSQETDHKLATLKDSLQDSPSERRRSKIEREVRKLLLNKDGERFSRREKAKAALRKSNSSFRWRRKSKQWSSAQEPNLSPIAQSHRSFSPRPSRQLPSNNPDTHKGGSTDPILPKGQPDTEDQMASAEFHDELHDTSGSSGTVVQTPHRQTQARVSPAALELFENGISFENLDQPGSSRQQSLSYLSPELPGIHLSNAGGTKLGSFLTESNSLPPVKVTTPGSIAVIRNSGEVKNTTPFLEKQAQRGPFLGEMKKDPKGWSTASSESLPNLPALIQLPLNHNSILGLFDRTSYSLPLESTSQHQLPPQEPTSTHPKPDAFPPHTGRNAQHLPLESLSTAAAEPPVLQRNAKLGG